MKIKSPVGFMALWSAFLAAGTWMLPMAVLPMGMAHAATAALSENHETSKLIQLEDVLVSADEDLPGGPTQQICLRLGIPVDNQQDAGFVAEGSLRRGLEFAIISGESDSGFRVQVQVDSRLVLQNIHATTQDGRGVMVKTTLFSGTASHGSTRIGVLGLAISTTVSATPGEADRSATIVVPFGETYHAGLASAFVRQTEALMRDSDPTGVGDGDDSVGGGGITCIPACQCQCGVDNDVCERIAKGAFWVCVGLTVTTAHCIILGTCLIGCAAASVAFLPCFFGCAKIVAKHAITQIRHCLVGASAAFALCDLGLSDCLNGCSP